MALHDRPALDPRLVSFYSERVTGDPARGGAAIRDGHIVPADAPGMGAEVDW